MYMKMALKKQKPLFFTQKQRLFHTYPQDIHISREILLLVR